MKKKPVAKKVFYALIPLMGFLLITELVVRVSGVADGSIAHRSLPVIAQPDEDLFWSHRPGQQMLYMGANVTINNLGLRGADIKAKRADEFRILSLGESTTFGLKVDDESTYAAVLQRYLRSHAQPGRVNVINAGIGAYTSFQSLMYLKLRGLQLKPDMVLFYHEYNDSLPTQGRDSNNSFIGLSLTDEQRFDDDRRKFHRKVLSIWATYRFLHHVAAGWRIYRFEQAARKRTEPGPMMVMTGYDVAMDSPQRVSLAERKANFAQMLELSKEHGFKLVMIHPSYRQTARHECELTEFCKDNQVAMYDAHDALHPSGVALEKTFFANDIVHPNELGHRNIGQALGRFLIDQKLVPLAK